MQSPNGPAGARPAGKVFARLGLAWRLSQWWSPAVAQGVGATPGRVASRRPDRAWWPYSLAVAGLAAAQVACAFGGRVQGGSATEAPGSQGTPPTAAEGTVQVGARLTGFTLSATTLKAGAVTFVVENDDPFIPHDFALQGEGVDVQTARLGPGDTATLTVDLAPGTYSYFCTMEGHRESMSGTLVVE